MPTLDAEACTGLIDDLTGIVRQAASAILTSDARPRAKPNGSPVTAADEAAEAVICEGLQRIAPDVPVVSEEQARCGRPPVATCGTYFLVDPLDGTREFIAGRAEFTVNIALMRDGAPILGVICAPALRQIWHGIIGHGAYWLDGTGETTPRPVHVRRIPAKPTVLVSRSHLDERTRVYIEKIASATLVRCGSSVKFCRIAEGKADLYPRLAPTHDWDIAAGHAVLLAAGGSLAAPDGSAIVYGTKDLTVPGFVAGGEIKG